MKTDIFRPIKIGKEVFHAKSYDENSFVMDWTMEVGGKVPKHIHKHMDEHFTVTQGEVLFTVNGEKILKKLGEELFVPKGATHSITNPIKGQIGLAVVYSPCADTHRMFEIIATLDEAKPGSVMNLLKYFYLVPKLGLKEFSSPTPAFVMSIMNFIVSIIGGLSGWSKLVKQFK